MRFMQKFFKSKLISKHLLFNIQIIILVSECAFSGLLVCTAKVPLLFSELHFIKNTPEKLCERWGGGKQTKASKRKRNCHVD